MFQKCRGFKWDITFIFKNLLFSIKYSKIAIEKRRGKEKMQKFFVEENQIDRNQVVIQGTDVNHIKNVLRMKTGDILLVGNKQTKETYLVEITSVQAENIGCKIKEKQQEKKEQVAITLYQGLPKADKLEWIIQKTTEIGIHSIVPVITERTIVKLDPKDKTKKQDRWQKIAEVAAKQCKRSDIPEIKGIRTLEEIGQDIKEYDIFLIAYEEEKANTLKYCLRRSIELEKEIKNVGIFIGPEGGVSIREIEKLKSYGENVKCVTLGDNILRTETAPMVMLANIL